MGKKRPQRKIMGNLKKLENVCASNTSLTEVAMNKPIKVDAMEIKIIAAIKIWNGVLNRFTKNTAAIKGTKAFAVPKSIAPEVFANIIRLKGVGESNTLSKVLLFFSNVMVTESMDVVPKRIEMAIIPGNMDSTSVLLPPVMIKNMPAHAKGKIIPQLMFGGLR